MLLIHNACIITPNGVIERGWLLAESGIIAAFGAGDAPSYPNAEITDAEGLTLLPGFVDVHVHGSDGCDTMDATPEALHTVAHFYARHGVTSFLATTWTDTRDRITAALNNVAQHMDSITDGANLVGVHLEGPYINAAKGGAQNLDLIRRAERDEALPWLELNVIRELSLAPEFPENHWLIAECVRRGITVSIAHTDATVDQTWHGIELGIRHATHTFNAMPGLHHREPGVLGAILADERITCELIADNIHVHPAAMNVLWRLKGPHNVVLISDAIRATGKPDGEYPVDDRIIYVKNGVARLANGTLAGSTLTMNRALYNFMQATGEPLEHVWQCASLNPARAIHMAHRKGSIEIGKDADLILVDAQINVRLTIVKNRIVR
jgi:N-acetylglucosamine-6-phosphate deacetylase